MDRRGRRCVGIGPYHGALLKKNNPFLVFILKISPLIFYFFIFNSLVAQTLVLQNNHVAPHALAWQDVRRWMTIFT